MPITGFLIQEPLVGLSSCKQKAIFEQWPQRPLLKTPQAPRLLNSPAQFAPKN